MPDEKKNLSPKDQLLEDLKTKEEHGMEVTKAWTAMWHESLRYFFSDQLHAATVLSSRPPLP